MNELTENQLTEIQLTQNQKIAFTWWDESLSMNDQKQLTKEYYPFYAEYKYNIRILDPSLIEKIYNDQLKKNKFFYQWEITNKENNRSLVISGDNSLESATERALKSAAYYQNECQYIVETKIKTYCTYCYNSGKVKKINKRNPYIFQDITCPECKGKFKSQEFIL